jgi:hypothetical protein
MPARKVTPTVLLDVKFERGSVRILSYRFTRSGKSWEILSSLRVQRVGQLPEAQTDITVIYSTVYRTSIQYQYGVVQYLVPGTTGYRTWMQD